MYLSLYCKGSKRVTHGFTVRRSWRPNRTAIYWPPLLWPSALCLSRSPDAQLEDRRLSFLLSAGFLYPILSPTGLRNYWGPWGPLRPGVAFPTTSYQQLLWFPTHLGLQGPLRRGVAFPTTSRLWLQLSGFLSWLNYIIVQHPLNRPLNLWNGMFDRYQEEINVMQFTGHSLPVHHSVAAQWDLHLVPYHQPSSPARFLSINGHWDVSYPLSLEWHVCPGRRSKYNTRIWTRVTVSISYDDNHYTTGIEYTGYIHRITLSRHTI